MKPPTNLLGWRPTGAADTAKVLRLLEAAGHGFKVIGHALDTIIIRGGYSLQYRWFSFCDNGGEINVEEINRPETMRSIGTADVNPKTGHPANLETVFSRLAAALLGRSIDYADHETAGDFDCILHRHGIEAAGRRLEQAATAYAVPAPPGESQESYSARAAGFVGDPRPLETRRKFPE